jgi:glyoxylase-like metal-dependent hydrolase (beta-lactamase superfamily II)
MCPKAKILMHPLEHNSMQSLEEITATAGWEEVMNDHQLALSDLVSFSEKSGQAWRIDGSINDGDIIDCGTTKIVVLHTPGHSPGHCSFYFPDRELVFLGDICLTKVGPWYGDEKASINDFIDSIDRIIALRPRMMAAGHSSQIFTTPIVVPTLLEYRDRILKREQRIFSYLKSHTCNIDQLANQHLIYRDHPNIFVLFWEKYMIKKHLERLLETGCIEPVDDEQYLAV